ncbi:hypothetical protein NQ317_015267 [Molorchus minor]|uniref:MULE transposase domain-containing protein n=1 Tax=Molorchus minor TaxID=1323400 RepID=A0ABQ9IYR5_9CUCU|nr:hypothetical protein NQ317_015267 [Molorchus minor]
MDNVQYVRDNGRKICTSNNTATYYYNCNRSFMSRGNKTCVTSMKTQIGKRLTKSQGSSKLDFNCTSQIKVVHEQNNKISVTYYKTHYKHDKQIQHLRISKADRTIVANKLMSGVSISKIIDSNRDNIEGENLNRVALLTRKDINNIKMSYGIVSDDGKRNHNDAVSVDMFVEEEKLNKENNYILYYKKQGVIQENDLLKEEDFCIILLKNSQQLMLEKFGGNTIAIDSTHGLNQYDFELTTILVIDEYGEGFLQHVCFLIEKTPIYLNYFLPKLKRNLENPYIPKLLCQT